MNLAWLLYFINIRLIFPQKGSFIPQEQGAPLPLCYPADLILYSCLNCDTILIRVISLGQYFYCLFKLFPKLYANGMRANFPFAQPTF